MNPEHDDFARQHPALDQALREQLKAPVMDAAFRRQVMARIATQRAAQRRAASSPQIARARLRSRMLLQLMNMGAMALAAVLLFRVAWPSLPAASWLRADWWLPLSMAFAGAALLYGLQRARLLGWVRRLDF